MTSPERCDPFFFEIRRKAECGVWGMRKEMKSKGKSRKKVKRVVS
jgi:hypothetical protein